MAQAITIIALGGVNCYLLAAGEGFILIDTGLATKRDALVHALERAACRPGDLRLVVLTHGDVDHAGNARYLREEYGVAIAMHAADAGMVERGDMSWNRKAKPDRTTMTGRFIRLAGRLMELSRRSAPFETFAPDMLVDDGYDLAGYGLDARVVHLPGHSKGSIGVLTGAGDLFCGDLLYNWRRPSVPIIDDLADHTASLEKLRGRPVGTVHPGHGKPFPWSMVK
jgi:glyoxylase-like metal-dependent hydrolase (beta-lactamase superfamily II)